MSTAPQILILEDHDIVVCSISMIIEEQIPLAVITATNNFTEGKHLLSTGLHADLVILDVELPGGEFYGMIETLRKIQPGIRILVFTGQAEGQHALRFLSAGANGFLSKNARMDEIGRAITRVLMDKKYIPEQVQDQISNNFLNKVKIEKVFEQSALSPRELEVLELLIKGIGIKEIATELNLKLTTVSTHKARIYEKLNVSNVIELFRKVKLGETAF